MLLPLLLPLPSLSSLLPVLPKAALGSLAGLLIEINRFFPDALTFPFFNSSYCRGTGRKRLDRDTIKYL
ncbi:hypothetical protein ES332_D11G254000v1 [Gossypium tomentosum]|uniref:Photosystem I reaction center subunit IX n=1 Tax=Gossypium tomentosum TaxID=34277 RepID=A0A5D2ISA1_GOSTO|nr:hypothetical protein ES332_D11G254000v1 [Gossypium tomentosum]